MSIEKLTFHKIFVGNVPYECTDKEFRDVFKNVSGYVSADIKRKKNSIISRGFGFVVLKTKPDVETLLSTTIILKNRKLRLLTYDMGIKKNTKIEENILYINNIPPFISLDALIEKISEIGTITKFTVKYNTNIICGELLFKNKSAYDRAITSIIYMGDVEIKLMPYKK